MEMLYEVIIIGGGPAGLMVANQLEKKHIKYVLLEKNDQCGKKLIISGGTRCNVTNHLSKREFIERSTLPHKKFLYPMIQSFGPEEVIAFFSDHDCKLVLENNFKYFPESNLSSSVLEALLKNIDLNHIHYKKHVKRIDTIDHHYVITNKDETVYHAERVVLATGSNAYPSTGSSGDGLVFAHHLNIPYIPFTPAETYVMSNQIKTELKALKGVSIKQAKVTLNSHHIVHQDDLIFTHMGLSGPAIMHLSEFIYEDIIKHQHATIHVNLVGLSHDDVFEHMLNQKQKLLHNALDMITSEKIAHVCLTYLQIDSRKIADMKHADLKRVATFLTALEIIIENTASKELAYVNKGGIDTKAINPKTMEIKHLPNFYTIGEVTDLHGPIGGFNNTIALSSGYSCAQAIIKNINEL